MTLYYYKVGCKSQGGRGQKSTKKVENFWVGFNSPTGREHTCLSGSRGRPAMGLGCFIQTGLETTRTSPKALTDKP